MVLISYNVDIYYEVRFLMHQNKIVSHSFYSNSCSDSGLEKLKKLVESEEYYPDKFYTIDAGLTAWGPKIIEYNSFSCAGLYDMDYEKVVKTVEEVYLNA